MTYKHTAFCCKNMVIPRLALLEIPILVLRGIFNFWKSPLEHQSKDQCTFSLTIYDIFSFHNQHWTHKVGKYAYNHYPLFKCIVLKMASKSGTKDIPPQNNAHNHCSLFKCSTLQVVSSEVPVQLTDASWVTLSSLKFKWSNRQICRNWGNPYFDDWSCILQEIPPSTHLLCK